MYIGDIYLPILSNIDKKSVSKITKEIAGINAKEPRTVSIRKNLQPITLEGYLYNDGEKDDAQYAEDVEALQYRSAGYCYTKYADLDGFIEIENAEAPQTSEELGVRNYSVEGKYLPASKYERVVEVETEMRENEFNIVFPPHVALPVGATNVRVKTSQDSVKLSAPAFMAGDIPIYRPFPAFYPNDVTHSTGDTPKYDTTAYKMSYNLLDANDEYISYTFVSGMDVPLGSYRVVLRMKSDATIASDARIVVLSGDNVVVDSLHTLVGNNVWNIVKSASFNITQRGITYTIKVSKAEADVANLAVNYGFLLPDKRARVAFDVAAEYDVGECKVFDTITTDSEESTWIQVFNPEHDFAGDIVVQNSMFRWVIKQTAWKDATKVYNIFGSAPVEIGKLYNKAFGDDSVAIKFKEIKPNYLKFTFELNTGNATSESTSAKEIDTVEITPFNVVIDKDVIGAYKDHYTFESTPDVMIEYENGIIAGIDSNSVYGLIKSVNVTSSYDGDIIETTSSKSNDSYVVPFVIPCSFTSYLYKQAADLVISKDNGDVERKFWKDDFSVDSSSQYTGDIADVTGWGSGTINIPHNKYISKSEPSLNEVEYTVAFGTDHDGSSNQFIRLYFDETYGFAFIFYRLSTHECRIGFYNYVTNIDHSSRVYVGVIPSNEFHTLKVVIGSSGTFYGYFDGVLKVTTSRPYMGKTDKVLLHNVNSDIKVSSFSILPSESYADDFTTDTTERYQPVLGTVAYDDANKRMNVTTATEANGKASGRLKSYKFCEGAQQFDVTLPVGDNGDFICMVTHATDPAMTNGIGVGLQSDGAGNWNLVTLSGTTVTEVASSGLTDGKTARIEIEKDITGAYWYYIYDAAGPKPTTATGKLFTTLSEGYTGWYANGAGATTQTYAIDNISIRAESIVGRTNIEEEEAFWFRDEFGENSLGRYAGSTIVHEVVGGKFQNVSGTIGGLNFVPQILKEEDVSVTVNFPAALTNTQRVHLLLAWQNLTSTMDCASTTTTNNGYVLKIYRTSTGTKAFQLIKMIAGVITPLIGTTDVTLDDDTDYVFRITRSASGVFVIYQDGVQVGTATDTTYTTGYVGIGITNSETTEITTLDNLQISGTRVYNKPIHRGAMLETYHNGTQEVVGTTFIDDCQWDRSAEWVKVGSSPVFDTVNGKIIIGTHTQGYLTKCGSLGDGYYAFDVLHSDISSAFLVVIVSDKSADLVTTNANRLDLIYYPPTTRLILREYINGVKTDIAYYTTIFNPNEIYRIAILKVGNVVRVYLDGIEVINVTVNSQLKSGVFGVSKYTNSTGNVQYSNIQIIAASPDATNGIAACIPPIGGGARYGVEESVYNTFTTENVNKGVYLTTARVKTTNPNADEVSLDYTNDTTSITLNTTPIDVDATYTVKTTPITINANETDTLHVSVKNSTTCDQSTNYVESLSLIPVSGDDVLYPQDLAFISGVKPSQKRKVEVK